MRMQTNFTSVFKRSIRLSNIASGQSRKSCFNTVRVRLVYSQRLLSQLSFPIARVRLCLYTKTAHASFTEGDLRAQVCLSQINYLPKCHVDARDSG